MKHNKNQKRSKKSISIQDHREEFVDLFGLWTEADEKEFEESVSELESVSADNCE